MTSNDSPSSLSTGAMLISLDFELAWGTRGRPSAPIVGPYLDGTRAAIADLLGLFERYEVPATWAIVGALLLERSDGDAPHRWLAEDRYGDIPVGDHHSQPHWYARDVFDSLLRCQAPQEIACHTLTHLFVDPTPSGRDAFRAELQRFRELCDEIGIEQPTTFIYPKAMMGHFDVLADEGFRSYRGPEPRWYERLPGVRPAAALRLLDAKLTLTPNVGLPERTPEGLWMLPSSQFYSPLMSVGRHVSIDQRVRKAIKGLHAAAERRQIFHLWTHPFNMGRRTDELMQGWSEILNEAAKLREAGKLEIVSMGEMAGRLDEGRRRDDAV